MSLNKFYDTSSIHETYKKKRMFIFFLLVIVISFMSFGYASLNSILEVAGYFNLSGDVGDLEITNIELVGNSVNATSNGTSFYIADSSVDNTVTLVSEFDINFYRSMGSSNSSITFNVVIKNNSLTEMKLSTVNSTPTFNSGNSTLNYLMNGITVLTTFISPGEEITVSLNFSLGQFERNINYNVFERFEFVFSSVMVDDIQVNSSLATETLEFTNFDDILGVAVNISNTSSQEIVCNFGINNSNFLIVNSSGDELSSINIPAYSSDSVMFYLRIAEDYLFSDLTSSVSVTLKTLSPTILEYDLGDIAINVPKDKIQDIIGGQNIISDSSIDFTHVTAESGLFKNETDGDITYFYRGNVNNNYVSFAGFKWRIIKIDKYGMRVILNSVIDDYSPWGTNPGGNASLDDAISVLNYSNSPVKTIVDNWYNSNLSSYASFIEPSLFCLDTSYQTMTSSGNYGVTVYYFGSYIRNGKDSAGYTPEFSCNSKYVKKYNVGLISGDEVAFAGGLFNTGSYNYYLYNSSITSNWWTLSPSYYDSSLGTVGMLIVNGSDGSFYDWPNGSTIENSMGIRPVITLDTSKISGGSGIVGDEYTFG